MFTAKMKPNIAAVNVTLMTAQSPQLSGQITHKTKTAAGYGVVTSAQMVMGGWASEACLKLRIGQYGKKSMGRFRRGWSWTTSAEKEPASTLTTFDLLLLGKTIILEKSCGLFLRGAASKTRLQSITDKTLAYRQPDLFVAPPEPTPTQEGFDL